MDRDTTTIFSDEKNHPQSIWDTPCLGSHITSKDLRRGPHPAVLLSCFYHLLLNTPLV